MKLKINKTFTKEPKTKIKNQNNNKWIWNINNKENRVIILEGGERKEEEKKGLLVTN
jgi:IS1 family transposase